MTEASISQEDDMTPTNSEYEQFDADGSLNEKRQGQVLASVGAILDMIERERAGLHLFGEKVEMLKASRELRLQRSE